MKLHYFIGRIFMYTDLEEPPLENLNQSFVTAFILA